MLEPFADASRRQADRLTDTDALEYLHLCLDQFAKLATELVGRSPLAPIQTQIDTEDIIGEIQWTQGL